MQVAPHSRNFLIMMPQSWGWGPDGVPGEDMEMDPDLMLSVQHSQEEDLEPLESESESSIDELLQGIELLDTKELTEFFVGSWREGDLPSYETWERGYVEYGQSLSDSDRELMSHYKGSDESWGINKSLREGSPTALATSVADMVSRTAIPLSRDITVWRGLKEDLNLPDKYQDKGLVSTSISALQAHDWSGVELPVMYRIEVPKGTRVAYGATDEREIILPAGTKLERTGEPVIASWLHESHKIIPLRVVKE